MGEYRSGQSVGPGDMVHLQGATSELLTIAAYCIARAGDALAVAGKGERVGRIPAGYRGGGSGIATLRAGTYAQCRAGRRSGPGHLGAGAAVGAFVPWRRTAQLALHHPDQSQPQPAALAGA